LKHFVSLHAHPKLHNFSTGLVLNEWREIASGKQTSSILGPQDAVPPMAFDFRNQRLAIANDGVIRVIEFFP